MGVRGEAGEGQAALSGVHSSYSLLLIRLVLVPTLYYFGARSTFRCSLERQTHRFALRGGNADGEMLHSSLIPHFPTHFFPLLSPIPNESRELIRKI